MMKTITLRLDPGDYERLLGEAKRLGVPPDALARDYVRSGLGAADVTETKPRRRPGLEALRGLAELRTRLPDYGPIDIVELIHAGRDDLDDRYVP